MDRKLSIIIVNYNTFDITCQSIDSLYQYSNHLEFELILVDNDSSECNPELFIKRFPKIKLIKSNVNLGFAGGNNLGLENAKNNLILLLNSDTIFIEDCISPCIEFLLDNKQIGIVSPKLLYQNGEYQKNARKFKNIKLELLDIARPFIKILPYKVYSKYFLNQYFKGDYDTECEWLCGAFLMFRKSDLIDVNNGILDDRFFMYGEDALWGWQFRKRKLKSFIISNFSIIHLGGSSDESYNSKDKVTMLIKREIELYSIRNLHTFFKSIILLKLILVIKYKIFLPFNLFLNKPN